MGLQDFSLIKNLNFVFTGDASKLRKDHENLQASVACMVEFMGKMIMMLHKRETLTDKELSEMIQYYTQLASPNLNLALQQAQKKLNPLTPEQANRLQYYINKANQGLSFSYNEINDYRELVEEAKKEQSPDINPWPLIALGAFLLGLWLGSQK